MQYELWARNRETKVYEWLQTFFEENQFYFMLDQVDSTYYSEAMIISREWQQQPRCLLYVDLKEETKVLGRKR